MMQTTGDEYFDSREFGDLLSTYEEAVRMGTPVFLDVDELVDIADFYNMTGRHDKAAEAIDAALELNPGATLPLVFKAREALSEENIELAIDISEKICDKEDTDYKYLQAEILVAQNRIQEAEDFLWTFYDTLPADEHDAFLLDVAAMYIDYDEYEKSKEWLELVTDTSERDYKEMLARTLAGLKNYKESISIYEQLLDEYPFSKKYWNAMAGVQQMSGQYEDAITSSEYALAIDPSYSNALLTKAECLSKLDNFEMAADYYARYTKVMPHDVYGEINLAYCFLNQEYYDKAIEHFKKAEKMAKQDDIVCMADIYDGMASAYNGLNMNDEVLRYKNKAKAIDCSEHIQCAVKGSALLGEGRTDEAYAMFRQAITESGYAPKVLLRVIVSLYGNDKIEDTYNVLKLFFSAANEDCSIGYPLMAVCCWKLNKVRDFAEYFMLAYEHVPDEAMRVVGLIVPEGMDTRLFARDLLNKINEILQ